MRDAAERGGEQVTLIAADSGLIRRVTAALDRWHIRPDDSAGRPLPLTAPGLFLRQVAALFGQPLTIDRLLILLKHPLTATGSTAIGRNDMLRETRELELQLRRNGPAFPMPPRWPIGRQGRRHAQDLGGVAGRDAVAAHHRRGPRPGAAACPIGWPTCWTWPRPWRRDRMAMRNALSCGRTRPGRWPARC